MQLDSIRAPTKQDLIMIYAPILPDLVKVEDMLRAAASGSQSSLVNKLPCSAKGSENIAHLLAYGLDGGGKQLRPALTLLSGQFYDYNLDSLLNMATSVEILHTATLIHDDIIDKSAFRRGRPTINALWDNNKAILTGDFLFSKSLEFVSRTRNVRVIDTFVQTLLVICGGELTQSFNVFNTPQTREHYFNTIGSKTAALFSLTTKAGAILSHAPEASIEALKNYGYYLGIAFQIVDDILDFIGDEAEMGKPKGSDLAAGIITLPAMVFLERYPDDNPVKTLPLDDEEKVNVERAVELILEDPAIIEECYALAWDYVDKACHELQLLPRCASRKSLMDLADYVVNRQK